MFESDGRMGWCEFHKRLFRVLAHLGPDDYLVLESVENGRYVQVGIQDDVVRVESVSDQYLDYLSPDQRLTPAHHAELAALGFEPPTQLVDGGGGGDQPYGSPNHWIDLEPVGSLGRIAQLLIDTARRVHEVPEPSGLRYDCGNHDHGRKPQPDLGIRVSGRRESGGRAALQPLPQRPPSLRAQGPYQAGAARS